LGILYHVHERLWRKIPENYGVASGLFSFMMQSVIFTPPRVNWYVREALDSLRYKRNCDIFGMFFVEMDPDKPWFIEDLPNVDNVTVLRELNLRGFRPRQPQPERKEEEENSWYPLGETPTWKEISNSLQSNPTILIPQWEEGLPAGLERYENCEEGSAEYHTSRLFVIFTRHLWIALNPAWRSRPQLQ
jgi:hypothetical protein